jgi:hypothetical protein
MAFNVTALAAYTKTNENMLITKSYYEPKTAKRMQILTGVKSTIQVPSLSNGIILQDGSSCGFNASGETTISARVLTVGRIKINQEWCVKDLETKYTQLLLSPGSNYDALPGGIDQAFIETVTGELGEVVEKAIWQGDTTSVNVNLNKFDGLVKIINAASGTVQANAAAYIGTAVTAITAANVISVMQAIYSAIPVQILNKSGLNVYVGTDIFRLYQLALTNANLYHFVSVESALGEMKIHGTDVNIVSTPGLIGTNAIYALRDSNMFLGVDLENEDEDFRFWYSEDFDLVRFKTNFKYGVQVSQVAEIVKFTI